MKLHRLYSNQRNVFSPISFHDGLNVVKAEIRIPQNRTQDTHNLGKTTLCRLIDFCCLAKTTKENPFIKHQTLFSGLVFFLEFSLSNSKYLTIRRSIENPNKVSLKETQTSMEDLSSLPDSEWDHANVSLSTAKEIVGNKAGFDAWLTSNLRQTFSYLLRTQEEFQSVFLLQKDMGKEADWKPQLAHLLGFNPELFKAYYQLEADLQNQKAVLHELKVFVKDGSTSEASLKYLIDVVKQELVQERQQLRTFGFDAKDKQIIKNTVEDLNSQIAELNTELYVLASTEKTLIESLKHSSINFEPAAVERLFQEARVSLASGLTRSFEQLIEFNRAITKERETYLRSALTETKQAILDIRERLDALGKERAENMAYIGEVDLFKKYDKLNEDIRKKDVYVAQLEMQLSHVAKLEQHKTELEDNIKKLSDLKAEIRNHLTRQQSDSLSLFSKVRDYFREIVHNVLDRHALLDVLLNRQDHIDFKAEYYDMQQPTSADKGHTYQKIMCMAFVLALIRAHTEDDFPHFAFFDGALESLDDRIKLNLIDVLRAYGHHDVQTIITVIDSDMPTGDRESPFLNEEIVLLLHDESENGRLFKMPSW